MQFLEINRRGRINIRNSLILSFFLALVAVVTLSKLCLGADGAKGIRSHRQQLLKEMRENCVRIADGTIWESKHFRARILAPSIKNLDLKKDKNLEDLLLRILLICEEAYQEVGRDFNKYPPYKLEVVCKSKKRYDMDIDPRGIYVFTLTGDGLDIPFIADELMSPLNDFSQGIKSIYVGYTTFILTQRYGLELNSKITKDIGSYEVLKAGKLSDWLNPMTEEQKRKKLEDFEKENEELLNKYSKYFAPEVLQIFKETMTCKWCGARIDITDKREGDDIECPACGTYVKVKGKKKE